MQAVSPLLQQLSPAKNRKKLHFATTVRKFSASKRCGYHSVRSEEATLKGELVSAHEMQSSGRTSYIFRQKLLQGKSPATATARLHLRVATCPTTAVAAPHAASRHGAEAVMSPPASEPATSADEPCRFGPSRLSLILSKGSLDLELEDDSGDDDSGDQGDPNSPSAASIPLALSHADELCLDDDGELVQRHAPGSKGARAPEQLIRRRLPAAASVQLHNGTFWLVEPTPHNTEPPGGRSGPSTSTAAAAASSAGGAGSLPAWATTVASDNGCELGDGARRACPDELLLLLPSSPRTAALPMGSAFSFGASTFVLMRPPDGARSDERWARLAVTLSSHAGSIRNLQLLPPWAFCNHGYIGRRHKKATLPLDDLKARRRHARFVLDGFRVVGDDKSLACGGLSIQPHKGKPCALLLGRATQQLRAPHRLQVGDIICLGRSHLRIAQRTRPKPPASNGTLAQAPSSRSLSAPSPSPSLTMATASALVSASTAGAAGVETVVLRKPAADAKLGLKLGGERATVMGFVEGGIAARAAEDGSLRIGQELLTVNGEPVRGHADGTAKLVAAEGELALTLGAPSGALELVEDTGRRFQRRAKKEKKRQRKLAGGDSSSDSDDEGKGHEPSEDEQYIGCVDAPFMRIELVAGPCRGRTVELGAEGLSIGSSERCGLATPGDWTTSSMHARINYSDGEWYLSDCGSAGGTFMLIPDNGMRVDAGDLVRIGKTDIVFLIQPQAAAAPAAAAS